MFTFTIWGKLIVEISLAASSSPVIPRTVDKSPNKLLFPELSLPNILHNFKNLGSDSNSDNFTRLELAQSAKIETAYKHIKNT